MSEKVQSQTNVPNRRRIEVNDGRANRLRRIVWIEPEPRTLDRAG